MTNITHWQCPFCEKSWEWDARITLMLHILQHHPEEPLSGEIAGVLFKVSLAALKASGAVTVTLGSWPESPNT